MQIHSHCFEITCVVGKGKLRAVIFIVVPAYASGMTKENKLTR
jgi:hypothetical protein